MSQPQRAPFAHYRQILAAHGFRPSRRRGQNFLLDPTLHRAIAEAGAIQARDLVVEVGAGLGFLTHELALRAARVVAVEIDERLAAILTREIAGWGDAGARVRLCIMDALAGSVWNPDLRDIVREERARAGGDVRLVANLPYSVAGPLLANLSLWDEPPAGGAVLIQDDVAERITAAPGNRAYGGLSVLVQAGYEVAIPRRVGRAVFWPRPAVDSAILTLRRRASSSWLALGRPEREEFARFVRVVFGQRRKQIGNVLDAALAAVGRGPATDLPAAISSLRPGTFGWERLLGMWAAAPRLP